VDSKVAIQTAVAVYIPFGKIKDDSWDSNLSPFNWIPELDAVQVRLGITGLHVNDKFLEKIRDRR